MVEFNHEQVKLNKLHTQPKKGYKLGSASAAWKKIKSATANGNIKNGTPEANGNPQSSDPSGDSTASDIAADTIQTPPATTLREFGHQGEILSLEPRCGLLEVWAWSPPLPDTKLDSDTLFLSFQLVLNPGKIMGVPVNFKIIDQIGRNFRVLILRKGDSELHLELHWISPSVAESKLLDYKELTFSSSTATKLFLKNSPSFILVGDDEGFISVLRHSVKGLATGNIDAKLHCIRKNSSQPIFEKRHLQLPDSEILLRTSCDNDGVPIFDIVDSWLVYCPTKFEYKFLQAVNSTSANLSSNDVSSTIDPIVTNINSSGDRFVPKERKNSLFTPVRLPASGPLLNRVISTFSNTALDGLYRLSELSSSTVKSYLDTEKKGTITSETTGTNSGDISLNSIGKAVGKLLYSTASTTANTVQSSTKNLKPNSNQLIKILDLSNDKVLSIFKPPGGVSTLSLSPYDLQLVNVNSRGDSLFLWDLYRLPTEISLLGKFIRGKTSAIVEEIFWFTNSYVEFQSGKSSNKIKHSTKANDYSKLVNSGFGCITKSSGSIHWFNTNYLSGDHGYKKINRESNGVLDSWILPSFGAKRFVSLPIISNTDASTIFNASGGSNSSVNSSSFNTMDMNQLAILDEKNQLKLVSPLNGQHFYKYELTGKPAAAAILPGFFESKPTQEEKNEQVNPLSQAEIETSSPFSNLINNANIVFETYDFKQDGQSDQDAFFNLFGEFGNHIPGQIIQLDRKKATTEHLQNGKSEIENEIPTIKNLYIDQEEEVSV